MLFSSHGFLPGPPSWQSMAAAVVTGLCMVLLSRVALADVLVVTDSRHPIQAMGGERVIEHPENGALFRIFFPFSV